MNIYMITLATPTLPLKVSVLHAWESLYLNWNFKGKWTYIVCCLLVSKLHAMKNNVGLAIVLSTDMYFTLVMIYMYGARR